VAFFVPSTFTTTPGKGLPLASFTVPVMLFSANAIVPVMKNKAVSKLRLAVFMLVLFFLSISINDYYP
jgi:hypothetical protein